MSQAKFQEVGRVRTTPNTEVVLSKMYKDDALEGYALNKYVTSDSFTGFGKGMLIPVDRVVEFLGLFDKMDLASASN